VEVVAEHLAAPEGEHVNGADDSDVADVVGGESVIGVQIIGIGDEAGGVSGGGLVQGVSVVEGSRPGVDAAQGDVVAEAMIQCGNWLWILSSRLNQFEKYDEPHPMSSSRLSPLRTRSEAETTTE